MAIDNANKRFSILNMRSPIRKPSIIPNGTIASADMYHLLNLYYGITLDAPVTITSGWKRSKLTLDMGMGL